MNLNRKQRRTVAGYIGELERLHEADDPWEWGDVDVDNCTLVKFRERGLIEIVVSPSSRNVSLWRLTEPVAHELVDRLTNTPQFDCGCTGITNDRETGEILCADHGHEVSRQEARAVLW